MAKTILSLAVAALAVAGFQGSAQAQAQNFPIKPLTILVGSAAGGSQDFGARLYADFVSKSIGQKILIDNRPGAGGIVAAQVAQQLPADGYTVFMAGSGFTETVPTVQQMPFDAIKDFTLITPLLKSENYMTVRSSLKINTLKELVDAAKATPGGLSLGDVAIGAPPHMMAEFLKHATGAPFVIVHYRASSAIQNDLRAGRLDGAGSSFNSFQAALQDNAVRVLAIAADARSPRFPNVPTYAESGFGDITVPTWWGLFGPKGIPRDIVQRIYSEFLKVSQDPSLIAQLGENDLQPFLIEPDKFEAYTLANQKRIGELIKKAGVKFE